LPGGIGQASLHYGVNDMGSTMIEENVVSAAGTTYCMDEPTLCRLIRDAGFRPMRRDMTYARLEEAPGMVPPGPSVAAPTRPP